jgi:hypothetical protein
MKDIHPILSALAETPRLLKELVLEIPTEFHQKEVIPGKWSLHEHATHLCIGDLHGFQKRLPVFQDAKRPIFEPLSGESFPPDHFMKLDLMENIEAFFKIREETISMAMSFNADLWDKESDHPEYSRYTPYIMLRHLLMHDHAHLYKIEDLGYGIR